MLWVVGCSAVCGSGRQRSVGRREGHARKEHPTCMMRCAQGGKKRVSRRGIPRYAINVHCSGGGSTHREKERGVSAGSGASRGKSDPQHGKCIRPEKESQSIVSILFTLRSAFPGLMEGPFRGPGWPAYVMPTQRSDAGPNRSRAPAVAIVHDHDKNNANTRHGSACMAECLLICDRGSPICGRKNAQERMPACWSR